MSLLASRYGFTTAYGDGVYKAEAANGTPGVVRGISYSSNAKCLHWGVNEEQGLGWAEDQDGDLPWPESQGSVLNAFDENGEELLVILDEGSGLPYIINTFDGPSGSDYTKRYKDKVDPNVSGSGTDIAVTIKQGEHIGEDPEFVLNNVEQRVTLRPINASNRGASGYDSSGLPTGFTLDANIYADGSQTASSSIETIPTDSEYVFDHAARGHSLQPEYVSNMAEFRLVRLRSQYRVQEIPLLPSKGNTTEADHQAEFATPTLWLSRGPTLLLDRASGSTISGTVTAIEGPDGISNSAMRFGTALALGNSAIAAGTLLIWTTSGYTISGVSLTAHSNSGAWYLYYCNGAIPASLSLPAGDVFDFRLYSTEITASARGDYYTDVVTFEGKNYLPRY